MSKFDWYKEGISAQGDVLFEVIDELPSDAEPIQSKGGQHVIAHSETGHNHVMPAQDVDFYKAANSDSFGFYLVAKRDTQITHLRDNDKHKPIDFKGGTVMRVRRHSTYENGAYKPAID